ncbi:hypothetical protein ARMSODRAFT_300353 [Armillaria solidipes]|uniref:Uncharacterized protein n=1 Tax=Armillaria solidipes TaxID=1076256 RepID=A0A2H3BL98_9AGAR|nr:hypothetical protein ARMSODRAFT_300353 [Armillaria solidipes]
MLLSPREQRHQRYPMFSWLIKARQGRIGTILMESCSSVLFRRSDFFLRVDQLLLSLLALLLRSSGKSSIRDVLYRMGPSDLVGNENTACTLRTRLAHVPQM